MSYGKAEQQKAFDYVTIDLFHQPRDSNLRTVLTACSIIDPHTWEMYTDQEIADIKTSDGTTLVVYERSLIKLFRDYIRYKSTIKERMDPIDYINIDPDEFRNYRTGPCYPYNFDMIQKVHHEIAGILSPPVISSTKLSFTPVEQFQRGIKLDATLYKELKDDRQWDNWRRSTVATARAQNVTEVFEDGSPTDHDLFDAKQKYVYQIFERTLLTDEGKAIVREHEHDYDAQKVYKKLVDHYKKSTKASLNAGDMLTYITSVRIDDGSWKGTSLGFINHYLEQIRLYHQQVPSRERFSDSQIRAMLQNAVAPAEHFASVKGQADLHKTQTGNYPSLEQYKELLKSAATTHDRRSSARRPLITPKRRQVYTSDLDYNDGEDYELEQGTDAFYDIDSPIDVILANKAKAFPARPLPSGIQLPFEKWKLLTPSQQQSWRSLPDDMKRILLSSGPSRPPPPPSNPSGKQTRFAQQHELFLGSEGDIDDDQFHDAVNLNDTGQEDVIDANTHDVHVNNTKINNAHVGDLRRLMSTSSKRPPSSFNKSKSPKTQVNEVVIDGERFVRANAHQANTHVVYHVSAAHTLTAAGALVDRGANGGIAGDDVRVIPMGLSPDRRVNVRGVDNHELESIVLASVAGVTPTQHGPVLAIFHQYAHLGRGKTIHSSGQLEHFRNLVNDKAIKVGGRQRIVTLDGYVMPLDIKHGLPYLRLRPYTDEEWDTLPHVIMTSDAPWDPSVLDYTYGEDHEIWYDPAEPGDDDFDAYGDYCHRTVAYHDNAYELDIDNPDHLYDYEDVIESCVHYSHTSPHDEHSTYLSFNHSVQHAPPDYASLRRFFAYLPVDVIKRTFNNSTQFAKTTISTILNKHYKSPYPAFNVHRRNEDVATDYVYADTPAIDNGSCNAQLFVGTKSMVIDAYGLKTDAQFVNSLEDNIRHRGAMNKLISDSASSETSQRVHQILRAYCIDDWQSEAYQQHQNPAERRWQTCKRITNTLLDRSGSPPYTWLLCLMYVCFLLNFTYCAAIQAIPMQALTGSTPDISPLLRFYWWQPVYYMADDSDFPSESKERRGRWVGIAEHCGHAMTWKILADDTRKVIHRSNVRPATKDAPNYRLDPLHGEDIVDPIIKSKPDTFLNAWPDKDSESDQNDNEAPNKEVPEIVKHPPTAITNPVDLVGRTFLKNTQDDGQRFRVQIVEALDNFEHNKNADPTHIHFRCKVNDDQYEEILSYQEIMEHINKDAENPVYWKFKRITAHEGPLTPSHRNYKGSKYNVMIEWENGELTSEPLSIIAADDPVTCALYASEKGLLHLDGWKRFNKIAKNHKKLTRFVNQAKLRSYRISPKYKYGFLIPKTYDDAVKLDQKFGTTRWSDAVITEMLQLHDYDTFIDKGHKDDVDIAKILPGFKKIRVHLVFDVKHDGRHKARMVADGHLTDVPLDSVYSGVVSLRGLRMLVFIAELNNLQTWATDIGNAYLEAVTSEKVFIIAGPEFKELEGHILVIYKALYGLRTSGLRWHERFADCLRDMGFTPCKAEPDIWMRRNGNIYEYIAVYVDDIAVAALDPNNIINAFTTKYKFKLKGTGSIVFHLGMNFFRDKDGTLCIEPKQYLERMMASYLQMFGEHPKSNVSSPLEHGDHPELDTSDFLDADDTQKYQSLIGALQWAVSIGRIDITTAVMTLSSFRAAPRVGHLERAKRIYSYLSKMKNAVIRIRADEPDMSALPDMEYDWSYSVYGEGSELIPHDVPEPLGNSVTLTHYVDANLFHDMLTGRSVTGILHFLNKTPIDWFSKKQSTVETATYGSEFVAARICTEQIMDLRLTLRYLGVPINNKSYMFGDNKSVVDSSSHPHAKLHKRHTMLSFHRVREAIAYRIINFFHIDGKLNPSDILSKHWSHAQIWTVLQPLLFCEGDVSRLLV